MRNEPVPLIPQIDVPHKPIADYTLFAVFMLPNANEVANYQGKLIIPPELFLKYCINDVKERNLTNLKNGSQHSCDYFTDLNRANRHRLPSTLQRLNPDLETARFGIMSFSVYKDEPVKNKVYNQRVSSINPHVLDLERAKTLYYPCNYHTENMVDLYLLGTVSVVAKEAFCIVHLSDEIIQKAITYP